MLPRTFMLAPGGPQLLGVTGGQLSVGQASERQLNGRIGSFISFCIRMSLINANVLSNVSLWGLSARTTLKPSSFLAACPCKYPVLSGTADRSSGFLMSTSFWVSRRPPSLSGRWSSSGLERHHQLPQQCWWAAALNYIYNLASSLMSYDNLHIKVSGVFITPEETE